MDEITLRPIGVIRRDDGWDGVGRADPGAVVRVEVFDEHAEGLHRIEESEKVTVLFWLDRLEPAKRRAIRCHPRGDPGRPERGVFALRAPMRPNPIGVAVAELLRREGNTLHVSGVDALDGSPLIDIKSA